MRIKHDTKLRFVAYASVILIPLLLALDAFQAHRYAKLKSAKMYNSVKATSASEENMSESKNEDEQINLIQNELFSLQSKVLEQNKLNRELLKVKLDQVKTQINNFKNPYKNLHSVYAQKQSVATLVQIEV